MEDWLDKGREQTLREWEESKNRKKHGNCWEKNLRVKM